MQRNIVLKTVGVVRRLGYKVPPLKVEISSEQYYAHVYNKTKKLVDIVESPDRIFEVGMRSTACNDQHLIALRAAQTAGLKLTSNVWGAANVDMKAVGTMGHEHVQRFGSDRAAYRAMVERLPGSVFFLLDTFDTMKSGIPNAYKIIAEQPEKRHGIRFDSGDIKTQFIKSVQKARSMGIRPRFCLEDGWNLRKTIEFEMLRKKLALLPEDVLYGYGGHIVNSPFTQLTRDRVSAVWKLTQTGDMPTMKNSPGKKSIPGKPILYWSNHGTFIFQKGEPITKHLRGYECAFSSEKPLPNPNSIDLQYEKYYSGLYSPGTKNLVRQLTKDMKCQ